MKTLSLAEIRTHLSLQEIKQLISEILLHTTTEMCLEELSESANPEKIRIPKTSLKDFSDQNWRYYVSIFKELQPKILRIESFDLRDISGIETIENLEEVYIVPDRYPYVEMEVIFKTLKNIFLLPNLKKVHLGWFNGYSRADGYRVPEECKEYIESLGYEIRHDDGYQIRYEVLGHKVLA